MEIKFTPSRKIIYAMLIVVLAVATFFMVFAVIYLLTTKESPDTHEERYYATLSLGLMALVDLICVIVFVLIKKAPKSEYRFNEKQIHYRIVFFYKKDDVTIDIENIKKIIFHDFKWYQRVIDFFLGGYLGTWKWLEIIEKDGKIHSLHINKKYALQLKLLYGDLVEVWRFEKLL